MLCDFHSVPCCLKAKLAWQHVVRVRVRCVSKLHWRVMDEEGLQGRLKNSHERLTSVHLADWDIGRASMGSMGSLGFPIPPVPQISMSSRLARAGG